MSEITDILELVTKKFELLSEAMKEQNDVIAALKQKIEETVEQLELILKELSARKELEEDQIAEMDRLTQRASTQLKVMIQLTEHLQQVPR